MGCDIFAKSNRRRLVADGNVIFVKVRFGARRLKGMGGKEAVQEILSLDPDARVIVSSGYSNDPVMANFKDFGFCAAIVKPYQLQELSKAVSASV